MIKLDDVFGSKPGHNDGYATWLDAFTRKYHNKIELLRYLRQVERNGIEKAPQLDPLLAKLIADILDGTLPNTKIKFEYSQLGHEHLQSLLKHTKELIAEGDPDILAYFGLKHPPDTKGEITKLAMKLAGSVWGLGPAAFEGRLHPRKGRNKKG